MMILAPDHEAISKPDDEPWHPIAMQGIEGSRRPPEDSGQAASLEPDGLAAMKLEDSEVLGVGHDEPARAPVPDRAGVDHASIESLARSVAGLAAGQDAMLKLFESWSRRGDAQGKALEVLQDQLESYRNNFVWQEMTPLLKDVIDCQDVVEGELATAAAGANAEALAGALAHVKQMILDLLSKYDIEPYRSEGDGFDRATQHCVRTVPTTVEGDDRKIAALGVAGFRKAEAILRKEQVTVFKYAQSPVTAR